MSSSPGTLVLLRHGQSTWNLENRFTGWTDVPLTAQGREEARSAGTLLRETGIRFGALHTSLLQRAITTAHLALEEAGQLHVPAQRHWRLNERHYGGLQGSNKKEMTAQHGEDAVFQWRRSFDIPPPALDPTDARHPRHEAQYAGLPPEVLPATECLKDVVQRVLPYWQDVVAPQLLAGHNVLVVAHGNSLRALLMHLEAVSPEKITGINIPTGAPRRYDFSAGLSLEGATYLGDQEAIAAREAAVAREAKG